MVASDKNPTINSHLQVFDQALEVETVGVLIEVSVVRRGVARVSENREMVRVGGRRHKHLTAATKHKEEHVGEE